MLKARVMLEVEQLVEGVVEARSGTGEQVREVRQAGLAVFTRRGVADVQDHTGGDGGGSFLPVALLRAVFPGADNHAGDVLRVAHIAGSEQADLAEGVEARGGLRLDRGKFEAEMARLSAEAAGLGPVFTLNVIDDGGFRPSQ